MKEILETLAQIEALQKEFAEKHSPLVKRLEEQYTTLRTSCKTRNQISNSVYSIPEVRLWEETLFRGLRSHIEQLTRIKEREDGAK